KTTLLKAILGLVPLQQGEVMIYGEPSSARKSRIAYVPQVSRVNWRFPATVLDVVLMGRYRMIGWMRLPGKKDRTVGMQALAEVGMQELANQPISELSGGQ